MNIKYVVVIAVVAVIAIASISAVMFLTPAHITITGAGASIWHGTQYVADGNNTALDPSFEGEITWIIFHFNITATKNTQLNLDDCTLTIDGQSPTVLHKEGGTINLQSGEVVEGSATFYVEGIYENNFQLGYNGPADVEIS